jgi:hypothetical protein
MNNLDINEERNYYEIILMLEFKSRFQFNLKFQKIKNYFKTEK